MSKLQALYEQYHQEKAHVRSSSFQGPKAVIAYPAAKRVLDVGCGNGDTVRRMRARGMDWFGVEMSQAAFDEHLRDAPFFFQGGLAQFTDGSFDLVYSTEVLEHVPEEEVDEVVSEMCRVAKHYLFLTISLRPSSKNNAYHCTLRPRIWWEEKFVSNGFLVDQEAVSAFQRKTLKSTSEILSRWAKHGPNAAAFAANPPYNLFGETQFWFFAFQREPRNRNFLERARLSYHRQRVVPLLRRLLQSDHRRP